jgi:histone H3/H4
MSSFLKKEVTVTQKVSASVYEAYKQALETILDGLTPEETVLMAKAIKNPTLKNQALLFLSHNV